jgi:hypothetical protein
LAGDFFMKSISEASLLQKDAESAAASPEHKRAHNQQRVHRHIQDQKNRERRMVSPPASLPVLAQGSVSQVILMFLLSSVCDE